ncbi:MAG: hypothetical protein OXR72_11005 [Gemmatimonadota bacterium]|nr:hypothetical protein [Gemmatimonadota bacterium]
MGKEEGRRKKEEGKRKKKCGETGDVSREKKSLPDKEFLLAFGTRRIVTNLSPLTASLRRPV